MFSAPGMGLAPALAAKAVLFAACRGIMAKRYLLEKRGKA